MHPLTLFLQKNLFYLLLAVLALNLFQRRYQKLAEKKRFATLYLSMLVLAWMILVIVVVAIRAGRTGCSSPSPWPWPASGWPSGGTSSPSACAARAAGAAWRANASCSTTPTLRALRPSSGASPEALKGKPSQAGPCQGPAYLSTVLPEWKASAKPSWKS